MLGGNSSVLFQDMESPSLVTHMYQSAHSLMAPEIDAGEWLVAINNRNAGCQGTLLANLLLMGCLWPCDNGNCLV